MERLNRILLVEDHPLLRDGLGLMLEQEPGFTVVGGAGSMAEAREMLCGVDLAVIDPGLPDGDGLDLIPELRESNSRCETNPDCIVLILTASVDHITFARAVEAGASSILHKTVSVVEIFDAIRRLCAGESLFSESEISWLTSLAVEWREQNLSAQASASRLSPREREVLQALAEGLNNKEIAQRLGISVETERNYISNIFSKLKVDSRLQALVFAIRHNLVEINSQPPSSSL